MAVAQVLARPRKDLGPPLLGIGLHTGMGHHAGITVDDGDRSETWQTLGKRDRAHGPARLRDRVKIKEMLSLDGPTTNDRRRRVLRKQQTLRDPITDGLKQPSGIVLVSEPVIDGWRFLGKPMTEFVRQGEVLSSARWRGRIENDAIVEERDTITGATVVSSLRQVLDCRNCQSKVGTKHSVRVRSESDANVIW